MNPSDADPIEGAEAGAIIDLGARVKIQGEDMAIIGSGLHAVLAAEIVNPDGPDAVERARSLLESQQTDV